MCIQQSLHRAGRLALIVCLGVVGGLVLNGCRLIQRTAEAPGKMITAVTPGSKPAATDPAMLQVEVQRFADEFASRTTAALEVYAAQSHTPEARRQALQWKVSMGFAAVGVASGPSPYANVVDFLALTTITRAVLEEAVTKPHGAPLQGWLQVSRSLETNIWELAANVFAVEQQEELRQAIQRWWEANPDAHGDFFVRPQELTSLIRKTHGTTDRAGSIFSLVGLDPMAGLDPAVREVASTRLFAERAMFMIQRMPFLVRWQTELLTSDMLIQEQVVNALNSADRLSRAAESASQTAAALPDRLTAERQAILEALQVQEGKLRELSSEIGRTLGAGEKMSTSLNTTLVTFDALMKRFGVGEPATSPPDTNSPPFNILDYAHTAEQVAAMAQQLDVLLKDAGSTLDSPAMDKRMADLNALTGRARRDAKSVLNHAFLLAAGLLVLAFGCALAYRRSTVRSAAGQSAGLDSGKNV